MHDVLYISTKWVNLCCTWSWWYVPFMFLLPQFCLSMLWPCCWCFFSPFCSRPLTRLSERLHPVPQPVVATASPWSVDPLIWRIFPNTFLHPLRQARCSQTFHTIYIYIVVVFVYKWTNVFIVLFLLLQTIFLQDNVINQVRQLDLSGLKHLHYLYLQVTSMLSFCLFSCYKHSRNKRDRKSCVALGLNERSTKTCLQTVLEWHQYHTPSLGRFRF